MEHGRGTAVGAVESLLTSSCFRKGPRAAVVTEYGGRHHCLSGEASRMGRRSCFLRPESARGRVMMAPPIDVAGLRPRLGDVEAPPKLRSSLSSVAEVESEPLGRARRRPSAEARAKSEPWGRAKRSSSSFGAEPESEPWGRAMQSSSSSGAEPESKPWGRAMWSFLWHLRPDLAVVSLTLSSGTAIGAAQAALSSCQAGQRSGEVTAVTSALSTGGHASG